MLKLYDPGHILLTLFTMHQVKLGVGRSFDLKNQTVVDQHFGVWAIDSRFRPGVAVAKSACRINQTLSEISEQSANRFKEGG